MQISIGFILAFLLSKALCYSDSFYVLATAYVYGKLESQELAHLIEMDCQESLQAAVRSSFDQDCFTELFLYVIRHSVPATGLHSWFESHGNSFVSIALEIQEALKTFREALNQQNQISTFQRKIATQFFILQHLNQEKYRLIQPLLTFEKVCIIRFTNLILFQAINCSTLNLGLTSIYIDFSRLSREILESLPVTALDRSFHHAILDVSTIPVHLICEAYAKFHSFAGILLRLADDTVILDSLLNCPCANIRQLYLSWSDDASIQGQIERLLNRFARWSQLDISIIDERYFERDMYSCEKITFSGIFLRFPGKLIVPSTLTDFTAATEVIDLKELVLELSFRKFISKYSKFELRSRIMDQKIRSLIISRGSACILKCLMNEFQIWLNDMSKKKFDGLLLDDSFRKFEGPNCESGELSLFDAFESISDYQFEIFLGILNQKRKSKNEIYIINTIMDNVRGFLNYFHDPQLKNDFDSDAVRLILDAMLLENIFMNVDELFPVLARKLRKSVLKISQVARGKLIAVDDFDKFFATPFFLKKFRNSIDCSEFQLLLPFLKLSSVSVIKLYDDWLRCPSDDGLRLESDILIVNLEAKEEKHHGVFDCEDDDIVSRWIRSEKVILSLTVANSKLFNEFFSVFLYLSKVCLDLQIWGARIFFDSTAEILDEFFQFFGQKVKYLNFIVRDTSYLGRNECQTKIVSFIKNCPNFEIINIPTQIFQNVYEKLGINDKYIVLEFKSSRYQEFLQSLVAIVGFNFVHVLSPGRTPDITYLVALGPTNRHYRLKPAIAN